MAPDSKAMAALVLGVLGAVTGLALGGLIPATVSLVLARQADRDLRGSEGWLSGVGRLRWARRAAWAGVGLAMLTLTALTVWWLLRDAGVTDRDFPPTVD